MFIRLVDTAKADTAVPWAGDEENPAALVGLTDPFRDLRFPLNSGTTTIGSKRSN